MAQIKQCSELNLSILDFINRLAGVKAEWSSRDGVRGKHNVVKAWGGAYCGTKRNEDKLDCYRMRIRSFCN